MGNIVTLENCLYPSELFVKCRDQNTYFNCKMVQGRNHREF